MYRPAAQWEKNHYKTSNLTIQSKARWVQMITFKLFILSFCDDKGRQCPGSAGQVSHDSPLINPALVNIDAAWPGWCWLTLPSPTMAVSGVPAPGWPPNIITLLTTTCPHRHLVSEPSAQCSICRLIWSKYLIAG